MKRNPLRLAAGVAACVALAGWAAACSSLGETFVDVESRDRAADDGRADDLAGGATELATESGNPPVDDRTPEGTSQACPDLNTCRSDAECQAYAEQIRELYSRGRTPRYRARSDADSYSCSPRLPNVSSLPFALSRCQAQGSARGDAGATGSRCVCSSAADDGWPVVIGVDAPGGCAHEGQGDQDLRWACFFESDEFTGCDPGRADSCEEVCDTFRSRALAHYEAALDVRVRHAACDYANADPCSGAIGGCNLVLEVEGACYVTSRHFHPMLQGEPRDCSLGNDTLISRVLRGYRPRSGDFDAGAPICLPGDEPLDATAPAADANPPPRVSADAGSGLDAGAGRVDASLP
jgi:hypothetical protein